MPRVVFWGPDTSMTGNTHAAVAISTVMSVVHKASCLLMQGNFDSKKIETSYTLYDQLKASGALDNANLGVSALIRLVTSNKLTSDAIQNYAKPVLKGRLDILYGMTAKDKDGYNDLVNNLPYITRKAAEIYDLVFLDLPKGMSQKFVRDTLADAEIVVCICNQDVIKLDEKRRGHCIDVDERAHLVVTFPDGHTEHISSGEVSVRPVENHRDI